MAYEFKLPDLGEGVREGEVARWLVEVGQDVADWDHTIDGPAAQQILITLAENLAIENQALLRADGSLLTAVDHGDRLEEMQGRLGDGAADVQVDRIGPELFARVRLESGSGESPFTLLADRVRIGKLPVPDALIDWIVRQFDPTLALRKLPIEVTLSPIRIEPGRIVIGER